MTVYRLHHLARFFIEKFERLAYFGLEVSDEFASKVEVDFFRHPLDKTDLAYTICETLISLFTSCSEMHIRVHRRCVFIMHLCKLGQGVPQTVALEEFYAGMKPEHIQCVLRTFRTLQVI